MANDRIGTVELGSCGDIDQGGIGGQGNRLWIRKEPLVQVLERHDYSRYDSSFERARRIETN